MPEWVYPKTTTIATLYLDISRKVEEIIHPSMNWVRAVHDIYFIP